jgi:hypothetical protein
MSSRPISLDDAISLYVGSTYFSELAPMTRSKRRGVLRNMRAEVQRLSGAEISQTPSGTLAHSGRRAHQRPTRGSWRTA